MKLTRPKIQLFIIWALRILVGATFIYSGFSKIIDPWGFIYKIQDYLNAWDLSIASTIKVTCAIGLSSAEFCLGAMLLLGAYRRIVPWVLGATMMFMLPLTFYILIENPVEDCGCFGDLLVISNSATFIKNIILTVAIIFLIIKNRYAPSLITPAFQWIPLAASIAFCLGIGFIGYRYQPLLDFRQYPVGSTLLFEEEKDETEPEFSYIYEKEGIRQYFSVDSLPDDTWTFVDRLQTGKELQIDEQARSFALYDKYGDDVTNETISSDGLQMLVLIPNAKTIGYSRSYFIRTLNNAMNIIGGKLSIIVAGDEDGSWRENAGTGLETFTADDTVIKEIARGEISLVLLRNGIIQWKTAATPLPSDYFDEIDPNINPLTSIPLNNVRWLLSLSIIYVAIIIDIILLPWIIKQIFTRKNKKKDVTLHPSSQTH